MKPRKVQEDRLLKHLTLQERRLQIRIRKDIIASMPYLMA